MNWLLVIVLLILIGSALLGYRKGLIKTVFSLFSTIVALILTLIISPTVNNIMRNNEDLYNMILDKVNVVLSISEENNDELSESGDLKESQLNLIDELPLPDVIKDSLIKNNNQEIYKALDVKTFKSYISNYFTSIIINALAFIITFVIIIACLRIISILLDIISKLPVLNKINKTAGLLLGLLHGLFNVWILFIMLTTFGGAGFGQKVFLMIEESQLLSFIYNNNLILPFVTSATKLFF